MISIFAIFKGKKTLKPKQVPKCCRLGISASGIIKLTIFEDLQKSDGEMNVFCED